MGHKQRQAAKARRARRRAARIKRQLELLQAKMKRHILGLSFELLSMIGKIVLLSSERGRDTQSLCRFIQTCKAFQEVGLPILYMQLDGSNVKRGGWWWTLDIWNRFDPAEKICRSILSIVQDSRGDLFRFADFDALAGLDLVVKLNRSNCFWASGQEVRVSATIKELLALLDVTIDPSFRPSRQLTWYPAGLEYSFGYPCFDVQNLIILLGLSVMPNLAKLRLPIHSTSLRLSEIPDKPNDYPVHVRASWEGEEYYLAFRRKNFPSFSKLRELDLVYNEGGEYQRHYLDIDNFSWIIQAAPKLRTLRLANFYKFRGREGLDFHSSLPPCNNITTLSLIECGISFERCQQLLSCFPQLQRFKMTRSKRTLYNADEGYSRRERASLMLEALSRAAPGLKKIFLGECIQPRTRKNNWPEAEMSMFPTNVFSGLKTLGLTHDNLFQPDDSMGNADVLVNVVRGCPTLETLEIFDALHVSKSNSPLVPTLGDALQALAQELAAGNKTSHLKEIQLWYFDKVYFARHLDEQDNWFCFRAEPCAAREEPSPLLASDGSGDILLPISDYSARWAARNQRLRERENFDLIELFRSLGVRLTLQLEKGMSRLPFRNTAVDDTPFPQFRGVDPDETLWYRGIAR